MPQIEIDERTYGDVELLAAAWRTTPGDAIRRLVAAMATGVSLGPERPNLPPVDVHTLYAGTRVEATFDPDTHCVTIRGGLLGGQTYTSPSGARRAVVGLLNPDINPNGNGWDFWTVTTTGAKLRTLRAARHQPASATGGEPR